MRERSEAFRDEWMKLAAMSSSEVKATMQRIKDLEQDVPTLEEVGRSAGVGAIMGPASTLVGGTVGGTLPGTGSTGSRALKAFKGVRGLAGAAAGGAVFGGLTPIVRNQVERRAEIGKLRKALKHGELKGRARKKVMKYVNSPK